MMAKKQNLGVIILAAGKGTRMRSQLPKVLHEVCGQTLIERALRACAGLEPKEILTVVGFSSDLVISEIERVSESLPNEILISHALQFEQNGTGHAAQIGLKGFKEKHEQVLIISGDTPLLDTETLSLLVDDEDSKYLALSLLSTIHSEPEGFGRILRDKAGDVLGIKEHKDCSEKELEIEEINVSVYLAQRGFLEQALSTLENNNSQGEYYLTDIVSYAVKVSEDIDAICTEEYERVLGANSRAELCDLEAFRREELIVEHMDAGVGFEDPATTYIEEGVKIGADSFIGACTWLKGSTEIGKKVIIEGNSRLKNAIIGDESIVKFSSVIDETSIGCECAVGPFARLRPLTKLGNKVKIGNFVETKKAEFQDGAKASHLSYIGDAIVGADANIGAGTITCNYDGVNKHQTEIGKGSFIGSNSALVAPVTIGDGAYVGAGSVITSDVSNDSLGVTRSKQRVIEGWAKNKNKELKN